jgi:hypothetical protein
LSVPTINFLSDRSSQKCSLYEPEFDANLNTGLDEPKFQSGVLLSWLNSSSNEIVGYQVFEGSNQTSFKGCVLKADANEEISARFSSCQKYLPPGNQTIPSQTYTFGISNLRADTLYHWSVKAFDKYGNTDNNVSVLAVTSLKIGSLK